MTTDTGHPEVAPPPPPPAAPRRLTRSPDDKVIAGLAGGLGEYFDVDPVIFRIGFVAVTLLGGSGLLLYLIGWLVIPRRNEERSVGQGMVQRGSSPSTIGVVLLVIAVVLLARNVVFWGSGRFFFPVALLVAGGALLLWRREQDAGQVPPPPAPPPPPPPGITAGEAPTTPTEVADATQPAIAPAADADSTDVSAAAARHDEGPPAAATSVSGTPPPDRPAPTQPVPSAPKQKSRSPLGRLTAAALLLLAGGAGLADASGAVDVDAEVVLALAVIVVGLGLVVGAWWGRARGLIAVGVILTVVTAGAAAIDVPLRGGVGERVHAPTEYAEIDRDLHLFAGSIEIELRRAQLEGRVTEMEATVGFGEIIVDVPRDIRVIVRANANLGEVDVFGVTDTGMNNTVERAAGPRGRGLLRLDLEVGAGSIEVRRAAA